MDCGSAGWLCFVLMIEVPQEFLLGSSSLPWPTNISSLILALPFGAVSQLLFIYYILGGFFPRILFLNGLLCLLTLFVLCCFLRLGLFGHRLLFSHCPCSWEYFLFLLLLGLGLLLEDFFLRVALPADWGRCVFFLVLLFFRFFVGGLHCLQFFCVSVVLQGFLLGVLHLLFFLSRVEISLAMGMREGLRLV